MLLVTLAPSTGSAGTSFAEITAVVWSNVTRAVPTGNTVTITNNGSSLGSVRLTAVNESSYPSAFAGTQHASYAQLRDCCRHAMLTVLNDALTGFLVATLPRGNHWLWANFSGSDDMEPSTSLALSVAAGGVSNGCMRRSCANT